MKRNFASQQEIVEALSSISKEHKVISSQRRLKELLSKLLRGKSVGERRLRKIAIDSGIVNLKIFTRESKDIFNLDRCPVCDNRIEAIGRKDIWGEVTKTEFICRKCGYRSGIKRRVPTKYVFYFRNQLSP